MHRRIIPLLIILLIAGCSSRQPSAPPPVIVEIFGSAPRAAAAQGVSDGSQTTQRPLMTCGQLAEKLGVQAGCYNPDNASLVPQAGGSSVFTGYLIWEL